MTSIVWNKIEQLAQNIELYFQQTGTKVKENESEYNWYNSIYTSNRYRRAHIEIVDHREATEEELAHGHAHGIDGHSGH